MPKVEVILPLNDVRASLRSGMQRLRQGRHARQVEEIFEQGSCASLSLVLMLMLQQEGASTTSEGSAVASAGYGRTAAEEVLDTTNSPALPASAAQVAPNWWARQRQGFQEGRLRCERLHCPVSLMIHVIHRR